MIILKEILYVTTSLFFIGTIGVVLNRRNILITIMAIELMLLGVNLNFIVFSVQFDDIIGLIFVLFILPIAATESALGLAILSSYSVTKNTISFTIVKNKIFN